MTTVRRLLRQRISDVLRRAEGDEQWVAGPELAQLWATPAPRAAKDDLERFSDGLTDPFA